MSPGPRGSVLLADDEEKIRRRLGRALTDDGHDVVEAVDGSDARRLLATRSFDVLVADNLMPGLTGLELIRDVVRHLPESERPQVLLMTAHATVESAIEAMKLGALDYLQKPFEVDELLALVRHALDHQRLRSERQYLISERNEDFNHYGIVGRSRGMADVITRAERVAETKSTVLITGETGTGKEMVARAIHHRSAQREMPLIKVNCAAIPDTLLESELFGHVRGAFTGAVADRRGKFEGAHGGTIFLDEIADMSLKTQAKVLRVLQEQVMEPVGGSTRIKVDARVLAATNKDLTAEIRAGRFREDLYFRLNVVPIFVPPLRERQEDIPLLADHFMAMLAREYGRRPKTFEPDALIALQRYAWPGNVRELRNLVERLMIMVPGDRISSRDLTFLDPGATTLTTQPPAIAASAPLHDARDRFEREYILRALAAQQGNISRTADVLGVERSNLYRKMRAFGINSPRKGDDEEPA